MLASGEDVRILGPWYLCPVAQIHASGGCLLGFPSHFLSTMGICMYALRSKQLLFPWKSVSALCEHNADPRHRMDWSLRPYPQGKGS